MALRWPATILPEERESGLVRWIASAEVFDESSSKAEKVD